MPGRLAIGRKNILCSSDIERRFNLDSEDVECRRQMLVMKAFEGGSYRMKLNVPEPKKKSTKSALKALLVVTRLYITA